MTLYALDAIDDAATATRELLWPFDLGRWLRLVVVVFFLGGAAGNSGLAPFQFSGSAPSGFESAPTPSGSPEMALPGGTELAVIGAIVGVIALLVLGFLLVGSVMEFVFVESLSTDEIHVRRYFRRHAGKGLRLFAFRFVLGLGTLAVLGGATLVLFGDVFAGLLSGEFVAPSASRLVVGALVLVPLGLAVGIVVALANGFTTEFVVPIMIREDRGVLAGWRRFWTTLVGQWKQYGTYVLVAFGLHIVTEIAGSIVIGIAAVALAIPFLIVAVPVVFGIVGGGTITAGAIVLLAALLALYLLVLFVAAAVIYVPIKVFHRQFALLVLGDTNADFDVLGDRRPSLSA